MNIEKFKSLDDLGISNTTIHWNLSSEELVSISLPKYDAKLSNFGAIAVNTGEFTGRSPKDRFIVKDSLTKDTIWWGDVNIPFSQERFSSLYKKVVDYVSDKALFVRDVCMCRRI